MFMIVTSLDQENSDTKTDFDVSKGHHRQCFIVRPEPSVNVYCSEGRASDRFGVRFKTGRQWSEETGYSLSLNL